MFSREYENIRQFYVYRKIPVTLRNLIVILSCASLTDRVNGSVWVQEIPREGPARKVPESKIVINYTNTYYIHSYFICILNNNYNLDRTVVIYSHHFENGRNDIQRGFGVRPNLKVWKLISIGTSYN